MDKKLSNAEKLIMEVLWNKGEVSNSTILNELKDIKEWSRHTIKTYLIRLKEKGIVGVNQINARMNMYFPIMTKDEYLSKDAKRYFNENYTSLSHMVSGLLDEETVSKDEINELEALIKEYKQKL